MIKFILHSCYQGLYRGLYKLVDNKHLFTIDAATITTIIVFTFSNKFDCQFLGLKVDLLLQGGVIIIIILSTARGG